jgi:hypothetical protein
LCRQLEWSLAVRCAGHAVGRLIADLAERVLERLGEPTTDIRQLVLAIARALRSLSCIVCSS